MSHYPRWKLLLLIAVLGICGLYAMPNLYPDVPAIQISSTDAGGEVSLPAREKLNKALAAAGIEHSAGEKVGTSWLVRMGSNDDQLRGKVIAEDALGRDYVVALNLAPTTPQWLRKIGASPMNLGLDLRGGVHFLIQVDSEAAVRQRMEAWAGEVRLMLRDEGVRYRSVEQDGRDLLVQFHDQAGLDAMDNKIRTRLREFNGRRVEDSFALRLSLSEQGVKEIQDYAVDQNRTSLSNRVNELGVGEPVVQRQGVDRIVVQLPGIQDAAQARRILGRTATLEFRLVADEYAGSVPSVAPVGTEIYPFKDDGMPVILRRQSIVTGDQVTNAQMGFGEQGVPEVNITLDAGGARRMQRITEDNVGKPMAVLFIENKSEIERYTDAEGERRERVVNTSEQYVINVATIQSVLSSRFRITGLDSTAEASELALLLRAGGLAAPISIIEERTIGPSLGADNIKAGFKSMVIGMSLVLVFMAVWYKVFGLIANIALVGNLIIIVGILSMIPGATLTLPGIAGIVLTVGMAVDANVLIFEQIKQSVKDGLAPLQAIEAGFNRAFSTIIDANITTMIVAVILFAAGAGSVQGFAVTLFIGILTSMFTAIVGTRAMVGFVYGRASRAPSRLSI
ncbi:MAG: protein translocase subunit SecD [Alcanivoracaceae bacterium]|jgi:preprotein translocase subunit SecD|nr:protein translocase subunit SecD [Alcanivoracaceae bacterium]